MGETSARWLQYVLFLAAVLGLARPCGRYLARVFTRESTWVDVVLRPAERLIHRLIGVDAAHEMSWRVYTANFVLFGAINALVVYLWLRYQLHLPGAANRALLTTPMTNDLALNVAISFVTGTTWQSYAGETTLTYGSQCLLAAQGFLAGASGLAVGAAFIRGFAQDRSASLGNFWVDLVRALLWVLLPIAFLGSLFLVWQGVPCTFAPEAKVTTLEGASQIVAWGPVAVLEFIKNLGTNGGGFFNVNGAHPFANPSPLTLFTGLLAISVLPAALTVTFGQMTRRSSTGGLLLGSMVVLFVIGLIACDWAEVHGVLEGKETRFGVGGSVLAAIVTSNGATGSFAAAHDSFTPLGVLVTLFNMLLGEIVFGGLGTGLYGMAMTVLVAVFLGGLMIGRTPEFVGKSLGPTEIKLISGYMLLGTATIMPLTALASATSAGLAGLTTNSGPRGLSEIFYAFASTTGSNGLSLSGLSANSAFYNFTTLLAMLVGRYGLTALALALAGRLAAQDRRPESRGTLPTDSLSFGALVVSVAIVVTGLGYLPALILGPVLEQLRQ
jgi:K+-transporting ATPase ATPase A chain